MSLLKQYNASINSHGHQWQLALHTLAEMRQQDICPNVITYSTAISSCNRGNQWQMALSLLDVMKQNGVWPNDVTFNALISACGRGLQCLVLYVMCFYMFDLLCFEGGHCLFLLRF
jgi:pentatricopeptide repeat protein